MKPAPFSWHGPGTVAEAVSVLADVGHDGKVLAGGQSLIPVLAMRLAEPAHLIDINAVTDLDVITVDHSGVTIGALVRHAALERDAAAAGAQPLLRQALKLVAHPTIRNRGTTVGSLAHADPAGEMTSVLTLLGGTVTATSAVGSRTIPAAEFFIGPLESSLRPDELATAAFFPLSPARSGSAFVEIARRHGDYAICGVAAVATVDDSGALAGLRCSYLSVFPTPLVLDLTAAWQAGEADAAEAARLAIDPVPDIHATAAYRRQLAGVLTVRAARQAVAAAGQNAGIATGSVDRQGAKGA
ncbi:MAG: FAD binding domain-containing protein [Actinomycetota bacterium]|nr:FAD binding domain-containing protein [Actinomycetota bacterium]